MTTRTEVSMTITDPDGHEIIRNLLIRPDTVGERIDRVLEQDADMVITLSVSRHHDEMFQRIVA